MANTEPRTPNTNMTDLLIIKLSSLGDLFHALPAVRMLKSGLGARVDWVTQPAYRELVRCFDDVDEVITFPRKGFLRGAPAYLRALRARRYDYVVDLQGLLKSALLVGRMARAGRRVGPPFSREGSRWLYSDVAPARGEGPRHIVEELADVAAHLGLPVTEPAYPLSVPDYPVEDDGPRVAIVPRSRWPAKNWPVEDFIEVGRRLREEPGASLYLVGGPEDTAVCAEIEKGVGESAVNTCARLSLVEMVGLLKKMDLVLSVDSGPMHAAAAVRTPVLAIFRATDPRRTGPYGTGHRVLMDEALRGDPDLARAFKKPPPRAPWTVRPEEVTAAARAMLAGRAS